MYHLQTLLFPFHVCSACASYSTAALWLSFHGLTHPCHWKRTYIGPAQHTPSSSLFQFISFSLLPFIASAYVQSSSQLWVCLKRKKPNTYKGKKKNTQNTILQVKILESSVGSLITWSLIFSLLSYQYSTLFRLGIWLSESFIKYNLFQHSVKTNRLLVEDPVVYVFRKRVTVGVHFMWSLLFQTEQMAEQNKHLYVNCCMFTCKSVTV